MHGGAARRWALTMAGDGALCGFIYLEGSTWAGPEDPEALVPVSLGIITNGSGGVRGYGGLRASKFRGTPLLEAPPLGVSTCMCPCLGPSHWFCAAFWSLATLPSLALQEGWGDLRRETEAQPANPDSRRAPQS